MKGQKEKGTNKKIRREKSARDSKMRKVNFEHFFLFCYKKATRNFQTCELAERKFAQHQF